MENQKTTELWYKNFEYRVDTWDKNGEREKQHCGVFLEITEESHVEKENITENGLALLEAIETVLDNNIDLIYKIYQQIISNS